MKIRGFQAIPVASSTPGARAPFANLRPIKHNAALAVPFRKAPPLVKNHRDIGPLMDHTVDFFAIAKPPVLDSALSRLASNPQSMMMAHVFDIHAERLMKLLH